jgi:hypothetical protein
MTVTMMKKEALSFQPKSFGVYRVVFRGALPLVEEVYENG